MKKFLSKGYVRLAIFVILIAILVLIGRYFSIDREKMDAYFKSIPPLYSSLIFIALYVASNFFVTGDPKEILKLVSVFVFGVYLSTLLIYLAEIINATLFFHLSRFFGEEFMDKYLKGRFKHIYERLGQMNLNWVFMLRLNILIPYRVLDICFGLSKISFRRYLTAVLLVSLPRIFFLQYIVGILGNFSLGNIMNMQMHPAVAFLFVLYFIFSIVVIFKTKKRLW
ncbi:MAG: VTT domain-containing protein [Candidatus Omnitrophica bacterium]|nr:VTT domain-containing protein [Candidatus Omnitrophota bacterium]